MASVRRSASARGTAIVALVIVAFGARLVIPVVALAANSWSISASPTTVSPAGTTVVRITAVNTSSSSGGGDAIGCIKVVIPASFVVTAQSLVSAPAGTSWSVDATGAGSTTITAAAAADGDRLAGNPANDQVVFDVTVENSAAGTYNWTSNEFNKPDCSSTFSQPIQLAITVATANTPPVAVLDSLTVLHDRTRSVAAPGVLGNDTDVDGDPLTAVLDSGPANGSVTLNANGSWSYTPGPGYLGADSFRYHANDGSSNSNVVAVALVVTDTPPVGAPDSYAVAKNATLTVGGSGVLANDTDADADPLTAAVATGPTHGTLTLAAAGSLTYTPTTGYAGPDAFTYAVSDGAMSDLATVTVSIANDAPIAVDDSYSGSRNLALIVGAGSGVLANDSDPNGDPLTASVLTPPANGLLLLAFDGSFTYTPALGFSGVDTFSYLASDGTTSASATVTLSIGNLAPTATDDSWSVAHDRVLTVPSPGVLANDTDPNGDALTAVFGSGPVHGSIALAADGGLVYTPGSGYVGPDSFTYRADDGSLTSAPATVSLTVTNAAPVAVDDSAGTPKNVALTVPAPGVLANDSDPDGDALTASLVAGPASGSLSLAADGSYTFTPATGFVGSVSFTYSVSDGIAASSPATVTIVVANSAPSAADDSASVFRNGTLTTVAPGVLANDADPNGDPLAAILVSPPSLGAVSLAADGSYVYSPTPGLVGTDSFTYRVTDGALSSAPATVTLTITNRAPTLVDASHSVIHGQVLSVPAGSGVLAGASDPDGDLLIASAGSLPTHGIVAVAPDGSFTYTPDTGYAGPDSFVVGGSDGLTSTLATISIAVTNRVPAGAADQYSVDAGGSLVVSAPGVLANDADADGDAMIASIATLPSNGTAVLAPSGALTYVPNPGFSGTDRFTYRVSDGIGQSAPVTITIHVRRAPSASPPPTATPSPTVTPAPAASPTPSPTPPAPSSEPTQTPTPSGTPTASPSPSLTSGPLGSGTGSGPTMNPRGPDAFSLAASGDGEPIHVDLAGLGLGFGGLFIWAVPGLILSVPGMLVVLIILAQAAGGLAWLPVARRKIGTFGLREAGSQARRSG